MLQRLIAVTSAVVLLASACGDDGSEADSTDAGSAQGNGAADTGTSTLRVESHADLGAILTDADGYTLYVFTADGRNQSSCADDCAEIWSPLTATAEAVAGAGLDEDLLSTFTREDGSTQVAIAGQPLYYFEPDSQPGEAKGQAVESFGGTWYAVSPEGTPIEEAPATPDNAYPDIY